VNQNIEIFEPRCLATTIGSLPHLDPVKGTALMFENTPDIPAWCQFPKRSYTENMMVQFTEGIPGIIHEAERIVVSTQGDEYIEEVTRFYEDYLEIIEGNQLANLDRYGLSPEYASGFSEFIRQLKTRPNSYIALKGQVTGPFTHGINIVDKQGKCSFYDPQLRDIVVKATSLKALWQIEKLKPFHPRLIIMLDEPSLLGYGSQEFLTVSRDDIIHDLNEVAGVIHKNGGLAGVHCEENTDWSILMQADLDLLVFDAYDHLEAITLYPQELDSFFQKGGLLGWGIVPTLDIDAAANESLYSLVNRFENGIKKLMEKGFDREFLLKRALITPSCGAGGVLSEPLAERVLRLLPEISSHLRRIYDLGV
jgi:hypothetical protein